MARICAMCNVVSIDDLHINAKYCETCKIEIQRIRCKNYRINNKDKISEYEKSKERKLTKSIYTKSWHEQRKSSSIKVCSMCNVATVNGKNEYCSDCKLIHRKKIQTEYRRKNKERIQKYLAEYFLKHKDYLKEYRMNNPDKVKQWRSNYYMNNKDKFKELRKRYLINNKGKLKNLDIKVGQNFESVKNKIIANEKILIVNIPQTLVKNCVGIEHIVSKEKIYLVLNNCSEIVFFTNELKMAIDYKT